MQEQESSHFNIRLRLFIGITITQFLSVQCTDSFEGSIISYEIINGSVNQRYYGLIDDYNRKQGRWELIKSNGILIEVQSFTNDTLNGPWIKYSEDGKRISIFCNYLKGKLHGPYLAYNNNESLAEFRHYYYGKLSGPEIIFLNSAQIASLNIYENDKLNGMKLNFDVSGNLISKSYYIDDSLFGIEKFRNDTTDWLKYFQNN